MRLKLFIKSEFKNRIFKTMSPCKALMTKVKFLSFKSKIKSKMDIKGNKLIAQTKIEN